MGEKHEGTKGYLFVPSGGARGDRRWPLHESISSGGVSVWRRRWSGEDRGARPSWRVPVGVGEPIQRAGRGNNGPEVGAPPRVVKQQQWRAAAARSGVREKGARAALL